MISNRFVLDQFKQAATKTMFRTQSPKIIEDFKTTVPSVYASNVGLAYKGDINALASVAVTYIETNESLAFEMFDTAIESAKEYKAAGELAYAIATILKDPEDKAKYYYQAILADGHLEAFKALVVCLPICTGLWLHGFYYAFFAFRLLEEQKQRAINNYYTNRGEWIAFDIYNSFRISDPDNFKVFFIQCSFDDLKKIIGEKTFVQEDIEKYQNELVDDILKKLVAKRGSELCFDNLEDVLLPYKNQYHPDYFVDIQNKLKQRIIDIENQLVPAVLAGLAGIVNTNIGKLSEVGLETLQPSEQKNIEIQLEAFRTVQRALEASADEKAIILLTSKSSAPLLPQSSARKGEDCIGPGDEKDNNIICIKFTKKYIQVMKAIEEADAEIRRKRDQNCEWLAWDEFKRNSNLPGVLDFLTWTSISFASISSPMMVYIFGLTFFSVMGGVVAGLLAMKAIAYLVDHYNHPTTKAVHAEKAAARKAHGFFENQLLNDINVRVASTLPTVSAHLRAACAGPG